MFLISLDYISYPFVRLDNDVDGDVLVYLEGTKKCK